MATPKRPAPAAPEPASTISEPSNEGPEGTTPPTAAAPPLGPTQGEVDELRDENEQLALENARLKAAQESLQARMERMERLFAGQPAYTPTGVDLLEQQAEASPIFDEGASFGTIWGDSQVAYMQAGHYFGPDRSYVRSDPKEKRGSARAFRPALVGVVLRPRVIQEAA